MLGNVQGVACAAGTALTRSPPPRNGCRIRVETDKLPLGKPREHVLLAHRTHNGRHQRQRPRQPQNRTTAQATLDIRCRTEQRLLEPLSDAA